MRKLGAAPWFRAVIAVGLVGALTVAFMLSPAGAAKKPATKKFVKKKIAKLDATTLNNDVTRHFTESATNSDGVKAVTVTCPAGKIAVGGGAATDGAGFLGLPPSDVALAISRPTASVASGPFNSWFTWAHEVNATAANWGLQAHVLCATP